MELVPEYGPGGVRRTTAITSATTVVWDMSALANRYVELYADQAIYFGFAASATDALMVSGELAASTTPGVPEVQTQVIGTPLAAATKQPAFINPRFPFLQVRALGTSTGLFIARPASNVAKVYG